MIVFDCGCPQVVCTLSLLGPWRCVRSHSATRVATPLFFEVSFFLSSFSLVFCFLRGHSSLHPAHTVGHAGVSVQIASGTVCAFVGKSGGGKSTICALLAALYDVEPGNGSIFVNGLDLRSLDRKRYHSLIGVVMQDTEVGL